MPGANPQFPYELRNDARKKAVEIQWEYLRDYGYSASIYLDINLLVNDATTDEQLILLANPDLVPDGYFNTDAAIDKLLTKCLKQKNEIAISLMLSRKSSCIAAAGWDQLVQVAKDNVFTKEHWNHLLRHMTDSIHYRLSKEKALQLIDSYACSGYSLNLSYQLIHILSLDKLQEYIKSPTTTDAARAQFIIISYTQYYETLKDIPYSPELIRQLMIQPGLSDGFFKDFIRKNNVDKSKLQAIQLSEEDIEQIVNNIYFPLDVLVSCIDLYLEEHNLSFDQLIKFMNFSYNAGKSALLLKYLETYVLNNEEINTLVTDHSAYFNTEILKLFKPNLGLRRNNQLKIIKHKEANVDVFNNFPAEILESCLREAGRKPFPENFYRNLLASKHFGTLIKKDIKLLHIVCDDLLALTRGWHAINFAVHLIVLQEQTIAHGCFAALYEKLGENYHDSMIDHFVAVCIKNPEQIRDEDVNLFLTKHTDLITEERLKTFLALPNLQQTTKKKILVHPAASQALFDAAKFDDIQTLFITPPAIKNVTKKGETLAEARKQLEDSLAKSKEIHSFYTKKNPLNTEEIIILPFGPRTCNFLLASKTLDALINLAAAKKSTLKTKGVDISYRATALDCLCDLTHTLLALGKDLEYLELIEKIKKTHNKRLLEQVTREEGALQPLRIPSPTTVPLVKKALQIPASSTLTVNELEDIYIKLLATPKSISELFKTQEEMLPKAAKDLHILIKETQDPTWELKFLELLKQANEKGKEEIVRSLLRATSFKPDLLRRIIKLMGDKLHAEYMDIVRDWSFSAEDDYTEADFNAIFELISKEDTQEEETSVAKEEHPVTGLYDYVAQYYPWLMRKEKLFEEENESEEDVLNYLKDLFETEKNQEKEPEKDPEEDFLTFLRDATQGNNLAQLHQLAKKDAQLRRELIAVKLLDVEAHEENDIDEQPKQEKTFVCTRKKQVTALAQIASVSPHLRHRAENIYKTENIVELFPESYDKFKRQLQTLSDEKQETLLLELATHQVKHSDTNKAKLLQALQPIKVLAYTHTIRTLQGEDDYEDVAQKTFDLYKDLSKAVMKEDDLGTIKRLYEKSINHPSSKVLGEHRGCKQALLDFFNVLLVLTGAGVVKYAVSKDWRFFKADTDSMKVVNGVTAEINSIVSPAA